MSRVFPKFIRGDNFLGRRNTLFFNLPQYLFLILCFQSLFFVGFCVHHESCHLLIQQHPVLFLHSAHMFLETIFFLMEFCLPACFSANLFLFVINFPLKFFYHDFSSILCGRLMLRKKLGIIRTYL